MDLNRLRFFHNSLLDVKPDQHHSRQHSISNNSDHTGRALLAQMPVGPAGYLLTAEGSGVNPIFQPPHFGRTATYTVAASDAPAHVKAQADYICDGIADEEEIQSAISASPAGGGTVMLSAGTFNISAEIQPVSNLRITSHGAYLRAVPGFGPIFRDPTHPTFDRVEIDHLTVELDPTYADAQFCMLTLTHSRIHHNLIYNRGDEGIQVAGQHVSIDHDMIINTVPSADCGGAILVAGRASNIVISDNYLVHPDNGAWMIVLESSGAAPDDIPSDVLIQNNYIQGGDQAFRVSVWAGFQSRRVTFRNNTIYYPAGHGAQAVMFLGTGDNTSIIEDYLIENNYINGGTGWVFHNTSAYPAQFGTVFARNTIKNRTGGATRNGNQVIDNYIHIVGGSDPAVWVSGTNFRVIGNYITGSPSYAIDVTNWNTPNYGFIAYNTIVANANSIRIAANVYRPRVIFNTINGNTSNTISNNGTQAQIWSNFGTEDADTLKQAYMKTIITGNTSVTFDHNLIGTPTYVVATPVNDTGGKRWWVSSITSTQITLSIDSAYGSDISFRIVAERGYLY